MLDAFFVLVLGALALGGLRHPAIAYAGYLWTDLVQPGQLVFGFALSVPFSLVMAAVCLVSMCLHPRAVSRPTSMSLFALMLAFVVWVHLTTGWATHPVAAGYKLAWAGKSLGFLLVAFLVVNTRAALDLFLATFVVCTSYFALQTGARTLLGGASYGGDLVRGANNSGMAESSTLGGLAVACVPLIAYLALGSTLVPRTRRVRRIAFGVAGLFVLATVGTHSRTGLVCLAVLFLCGLVFTRRRASMLGLGLVGALIAFAVGGAEWRARMATIGEGEQEASSLGRILVWRWTLDYVRERPLGGGFVAYLDNAGVLEGYLSEAAGDAPVKTSATAYHNILFEVLGEQGYPGFALYAAMLAIIGVKLLRARRPLPVPRAGPGAAGDADARDDTEWIRLAATCCLIGYTCLMAAAMFVGIAYRPYLFVFGVAAAVLSRERSAAARAASAAPAAARFAAGAPGTGAARPFASR